LFFRKVKNEGREEKRQGRRKEEEGGGRRRKEEEGGGRRRKEQEGGGGGGRRRKEGGRSIQPFIKTYRFRVAKSTCCSGGTGFTSLMLMLENEQ
jgi:hypothetical protein